ISRAGDEHQVRLGGDGPHRQLPVRRRIADVVAAGAARGGEPLQQRGYDFIGFLRRQRGLHQVADLAGISRPQGRDVSSVLNQDHRAGGLADSALDLLMTGMPDQHHQIALGGEPACLGVYLRHQRAGRVDGVQPPAGRLGSHRRRYPGRGEDHPRAVRNPPAAPSSPGARSTISIARSTPAQNDRGPASSTRRAPPAAAHLPSAGAASRSDRSAATPPDRPRGLSSPRPGLSDTARTTTAGRPAAAPSSIADSRSAASAPSRPSLDRPAPCTMRGTVAIFPAYARRPARRSSPASSGADGQARTPSGPLTSVPTTRSPGNSPSRTPPPVPAIASIPNSAARRLLAWLTDLRAPNPVCRTSPPLAMPRRIARASSPSGAHTSSRLTRPPQAAAARSRLGRSRRSCGTPQVPAEGADRENQPVKVVVDGEVTRKAGPGKLRLIPGSVRPLAVGQPADAALDGAG